MTTSVGAVWRRIVGYGIAVWAVPMVVSFTMYTPEGTPWVSDDVFESVMTLALIPTTCWLSFRLFARAEPVPVSGLTVGLLWIAISVALDIPVLIVALGMDPSVYTVDVLLSYPAIAAVTIVVAKSARYRPPAAG